MIYACPICGNESGTTHGDQVWVDEICEDCQEAIDKGEITWNPSKKRLNVPSK